MNIKKKKFELEIDLSEDISAAYLKDCECDRCADSSCECDCHNEAIGQKRFGGKPRTTLKDSDFLDPERRSFPVMSCQDVKDAVSSWGRYKGDMTFEQFKDRLTRKAKSIGCEKALPEKWKEESDAALTEKQKKLPPALQKAILKKQGKKPEKEEGKKDDKKDKDEEEDKKENKNQKGLTEKQKKLPPALQKQILKKQSKGTQDYASLWKNIHEKRERIKRGSGEKMRKKGEKGAPTPEQLKKAKEKTKAKGSED